MYSNGFILSTEEHSWWKKWKEKQKDEGVSIKLHDESKLMRLIRKHNLYEEYFNTVRVDQNFIKRYFLFVHLSRLLVLI